jgi:hypothetical protein
MSGICRKRPKTEVGKILNTNKMKKILITTILSLIVITSIFATPRHVEVIKRGGVRKWYHPWKITYDRIHQDPCVNCSNGQPIVRLTCEDAGNENCELMGSTSGSVTIGRLEYSEAQIFEICNKIMQEVDDEIEAGKQNGSISKQFRLIPLSGGNAVLIYFSASWRGADIRTGDVQYFIEFDEL